MPDWIIIVLSIVVLGLGMLHGALMVLSPPKHRRFVFWLATRLRTSRLELDTEDTGRGLELTYRLAGLLGLGFCVVLAYIVIGKLVDQWRHVRPMEVPAVLPPHDVGSGWPFFVGASWPICVAGLAIIALGIYFMKKPEAAYLWSIKALPVRRDTLDPQTLRKGGRIVALLVIAVGLLAMSAGIYSFIGGWH